VVSGDVITQRIAIEEGASFQGKIDIQKEPGKAVAS
jgi:cytoskeletal protein CcmA (bactofilin family)